MSKNRNERNSFQPSLSDSDLETRLVLSGTKAAAIVASALSPPPAPSPFTPIGRITVQGLRADYLRAYRASTNALAQTIRADLNQLHANGRPTTQQLADFNAQVAGAINATALLVSSQAALLPGQTSTLLASLQDSLMGTGANSLANRISALAQSGRFTNSFNALQAAVARQVNQTGLVGAQNLNNFFNTTSINRFSVDASGQRIPLNQFIGNQIVNQFANNLGSLANAFSTQAGSLFFNNNGVTPTTDAINAFRNQTAQGLGVVTAALGSDLSLLGNTGTQVVPQLSNVLFAPGPNSTSSFFDSILAEQSNLPGVGPSTTNPFNKPFGSLGPILHADFGLPTTTASTLPGSSFTNVFVPSFTGNSFNSGFNSGFGTGFIGFGTAPTTFNTNFTTGFNNMLGNANTSFGFSFPAVTPITTTTTTTGL